MTLQDRMAIFEKPQDAKNTPKAKLQQNKFADRLAVFEGAKQETPKRAVQAKPTQRPPTAEPSSGDKHYKFQVQTHEDSLANKKTGDEEKPVFSNNLKKLNLENTPSKAIVQQATPQKANVAKPNQQTSTPNSNQLKCAACEKTVYVVEQIMIDDKAFHKNCLKCSHCSVVLKLGNYASLEGTYYVSIENVSIILVQTTFHAIVQAQRKLL